MPVVPILSIIFSAGLIVSLAPATQIRLVVWLLLGLLIYFNYGRKHSKVQLVNECQFDRHASRRGT